MAASFGTIIPGRQSGQNGVFALVYALAEFAISLTRKRATRVHIDGKSIRLGWESALLSLLLHRSAVSLRAFVKQGHAVRRETGVVVHGVKWERG